MRRYRTQRRVRKFRADNFRYLWSSRPPLRVRANRGDSAVPIKFHEECRGKRTFKNNRIILRVRFRRAHDNLLRARRVVLVSASFRCRVVLDTSTRSVTIFRKVMFERNGSIYFPCPAGKRPFWTGFLIRYRGAKVTEKKKRYGRPWCTRRTHVKRSSYFFGGTRESTERTAKTVECKRQSMPGGRGFPRLFFGGNIKHNNPNWRYTIFQRIDLFGYESINHLSDIVLRCRRSR